MPARTAWQHSRKTKRVVQSVKYEDVGLKICLWVHFMVGQAVLAGISSNPILRIWGHPSEQQSDSNWHLWIVVLWHFSHCTEQWTRLARQKQAARLATYIQLKRDQVFSGVSWTLLRKHSAMTFTLAWLLTFVHISAQCRIFATPECPIIFGFLHFPHVQIYTLTWLENDISANFKSAWFVCRRWIRILHGPFVVDD